ncbi:MAG TPA: CBS domain-containing protein [Candidatus Limnocylindria bacterium]|jgi:predicted transcriptional regulator
MLTTVADMRIGNLMTINPVVIDSDQPVSEAERVLKTYRVSGLPVVEMGTVVGVISQADILTARSSELISGNWSRLRVRNIMTSPPISVHVETTVERAIRLMLDQHIHRLVVVDDEDRPVGVVTPLDILRLLLDEP